MRRVVMVTACLLTAACPAEDGRKAVLACGVDLQKAPDGTDGLLPEAGCSGTFGADDLCLDIFADVIRPRECFWEKDEHSRLAAFAEQLETALLVANERVVLRGGRTAWSRMPPQTALVIRGVSRDFDGFRARLADWGCEELVENGGMDKKEGMGIPHPFGVHVKKGHDVRDLSFDADVGCLQPGSLRFAGQKGDCFTLGLPRQVETGDVLHVAVRARGAGPDVSLGWMCGAGFSDDVRHEKRTLRSVSEPKQAEWKRHEAVVVVPDAADGVALFFAQAPKTAGPVWFDDVSVVRVRGK